jgi:NADH-quinone oxidoreductase subunit C
MTPKLQRLFDSLKNLGLAPTERSGELSVEVKASEYMHFCIMLRDDAATGFEQCMDLTGVDYAAYADKPWQGPRFAVALQLLSLTHNWRLRLRTFCPDDSLPQLPSLCEVWPSVNWYEREAFDLFGIVFEGHTDLRRILTDYGFIGHPFRKDYPLSGHVEMRYDPEQKRVIYQPVTIDPREVTPRIVRVERYAEDREERPPRDA